MFLEMLHCWKMYHADLLSNFEDDGTFKYKSFKKARSFGDIFFQ